MGFSCGTLYESHDPTVIWAIGDLDLAVAIELGAEIEQHLVPGAAVALDCAGIAFMDSMGLQVLLRAARIAREVKADFMLVTVPEPVRRVLKVSGSSSVFTIFENLTRAKTMVGER